MSDDQLFDSLPARLLTNAAYAVLMDFRRAWLVSEADAITFTWTRCQRYIGVKCFDRARADLIHYGFIEPANLSTGRFRPSELWRDFTLDLTGNKLLDEKAMRDRARIDSIERQKHERIERTKAWRLRANQHKETVSAMGALMLIGVGKVAQ